MRAYFTLLVKTINAALEHDNKLTGSAIRVEIAESTDYVRLTGEPHQIMLAIGAIANQGEAGLYKVSA